MECFGNDISRGSLNPRDDRRRNDRASWLKVRIQILGHRCATCLRRTVSITQSAAEFVQVKLRDGHRSATTSR